MRRRLLAGGLFVTLTALGAPDALATHAATTIKKRIVEGELLDPDKPGFFQLTTKPGQPILTRDELEDPQPGRGRRRRSLIYFAQLTDFQLADEESPARVEFSDQGASGGWRPQEAFHPWAIDQSMRRLNQLAEASPIRQGNGDRARMKLAVLTGDQADNQQFNETLWVRQLIEPGSRLDPGSGVDDFSSCDPAAQSALQQKGLAEEPNYVGVQDYEDFKRQEDYYDPDEPAGDFINWPMYEGLMDRAQRPFRTTGLKVKAYVVDGNHDGLVQGNEDANRAFEDIATSCFKATASPTSPLAEFDEGPDPNVLLPPGPTGEFIPPDPDRRFVSKGEVRQIFQQGKQKDDFGFKFIDPDEDVASRRTAWYYAWNPKPGFRFIVIDTIMEGGNTADLATGNIDDPQFQWLENELQEAQEAGKLIVVLGHHPIRTLTSNTPDEAAPQCAGGYDENGNYVGSDRDPAPGHNHALNPGCDGDPRDSEPLHLGEDLTELLQQFPNVIAYVPGHTHENVVTPFPDGKGGGFWELNTSAVADWPQQSRLIDIMDNRDGTLSIFSVVTDHASDIEVPDAGPAKSFTGPILGAIGRNFSYNDPQSAHAAEGEPEDRNVELMIRDPRVASIPQKPSTQDEPSSG